MLAREPSDIASGMTGPVTGSGRRAVCARIETAGDSIGRPGVPWAALEGGRESMVAAGWSTDPTSRVAG